MFPCFRSLGGAAATSGRFTAIGASPAAPLSFCSARRRLVSRCGGGGFSLRDYRRRTGWFIPLRCFRDRLASR